MNHAFKVFLSLSLSGSLLIPALAVCKRAVKNRVSRQWQYYIWLLVVARLLLPFAPEANLTGRLLQTVNQVAAAQTPDAQSTPEPYGPAGLPLAQAAYSEQPVSGAITLLQNNIWLVWLAVTLILFVRKITIYQGFVRYVKAGQAAVADPVLLDRLAAVARQAHVMKAVELCVNPAVSAPLLIGFFRPCIVLPRRDLSEAGFRYTVLHELTHFRRRDMVYKWLVQVTICLHWFNPLVYWLGREINRACELSCDEAMIARLDARERRAYGQTLLDAMAAGRYTEPLASVTLNEDKRLIKERIGAIMNYRKRSRLAIACTLVLTLLIGAGATAAGAYTAQKNAQDTQRLTRQESLVQNFAPYRRFGLAYDAAADRVYYHGLEVRAFVDLRGTFPGGGYAFNLGYIEQESQSALYLMAVHGGDGSVTGIQEMPEALKKDLYDWEEAPSPGAPLSPALEEEIRDSMEEIAEAGSAAGMKSAAGKQRYMVFNATTYLETGGSGRIMATDKLAPADIPQHIRDWIDSCKGSKDVHVKKTIADGTVDAWICYDSVQKYAWTMELSGSAVKLVLIRDAPETVGGATVIRYQGPAAYADLEAFSGEERLAVTAA